MPAEHDELRAAVTYEVRQQLTPYLLQVSQDREDIRLMKWTLYGNTEAGEKGLVKSVQSMQDKLDKLIDLSEARENQWKGIRNALITIGTLSSIPLIQALGKLAGIWP